MLNKMADLSYNMMINKQIEQELVAKNRPN